MKMYSNSIAGADDIELLKKEISGIDAKQNQQNKQLSELRWQLLAVLGISIVFPLALFLLAV